MSDIERRLFYALRDLLRIQDMPMDELDTYPEGLLTEIVNEAWEEGRLALQQTREQSHDHDPCPKCGAGISDYATVDCPEREQGEPLGPTCSHRIIDDCRICYVCGECREDLDDYDMCGDCQEDV